MNPLEFAIKMEIDGDMYYREQAKKYKGTSLEKVLLKLADDEKRHADLLRSELADDSYELTVDMELDRAVSIFKNQGDIQDLISKPDQLHVYKVALDNEKNSIDLYKEFYSKAETGSEKKLFQFLIAEEEKHFEIIEHIVLELAKAHEWVEAAEFGVRKEEY